MIQTIKDTAVQLLRQGRHLKIDYTGGALLLTKAQVESLRNALNKALKEWDE